MCLTVVVVWGGGRGGAGGLKRQVNLLNSGFTIISLLGLSVIWHFSTGSINAELMYHVQLTPCRWSWTNMTIIRHHPVGSQWIDITETPVQPTSAVTMNNKSVSKSTIIRAINPALTEALSVRSVLLCQLENSTRSWYSAIPNTWSMPLPMIVLVRACWHAKMGSEKITWLSKV